MRVVVADRPGQNVHQHVRTPKRTIRQRQEKARTHYDADQYLLTIDNAQLARNSVSQRSELNAATGAAAAAAGEEAK